MNDSIKESNILIVDDTVDNLVFLEQLLARKGFRNVVSLSDSRLVMEQIEKQEPDIILLDLMMPHLTGYDILRSVRVKYDESVFLPVVVLTAITDREARQKSLSVGATDFLTKPLDIIEVSQRVSNLLKTRYMYKEQVKQSSILEAAVLNRTKELNKNYQILQDMNQTLDETNIEIADRLAEAAEYRDDDTGKHTFRVGNMSALIATEMGMPKEFVELIRKAARLHDLGKIGIADAILLKPAKLTEDEFKDIQKHCEIGAKILSGGKSALLQMAEKIALSHHERYDGKGYPNGLSQDEIPIEARIVTVVDVYDALTHERPYKKAWPREEAINYITAQKSQQFDAAVVEAFLRVIQHRSDEVEFLEQVTDPDLVAA